MMRAMIAGLAVLFVLAFAAFLPAEDFQAGSVDRNDVWLLEIDVSQACTVLSSPFTDTAMMWESTQNTSLTLDYERTWSVSVNAPVVEWAGALAGTPEWWASVALGDPSLQVCRTWRWPNGKLLLAEAVVFPVGVWNAYEVSAHRMRSGSGYYSLRSSLAAILFSDPAILHASASYSVGLPRMERFQTIWKPAEFAAGLAIAEALNDRLAVQISVAQSLDLGTASGTSFGDLRPAFSLSVSGDVMLSTDVVILRIGVEKDLVNLDTPAVFRILVGREISFGS